MSNYRIPFLYCLSLVVGFALEFKYPRIIHDFGLLPLDLAHLKGIVTSVFLHANLEHLSSNFMTFSLTVFGMFYFYKEVAIKVTFLAHLSTGALIWLFARPVYHIGASGLIYALVFFILISALIKRNKRLAVFAFIVLTFQSGLVWGMMPQGNNISWESHLFGGLTGIALAIIFRKSGPPPETPIVFEEDAEDEDEYAEL